MIFSIYLVCLGVGFLFTAISAMLGHVFGHSDLHVGGSHGTAEAGADSSDMPGVSIFSPTIIASFVTGFGGFGIIFSQFPGTKSPFISAPLAVLGATCVAGVLVIVLRRIFAHTQSSSESHVGALVGVVANTISSIPENGVGEIAYVQAGCRYTAPARECNGKSVPVGKSVTITKIVGSQFYVTLTT